MSRENVEAVHELAEAVGRQDLPTFLRLTDPDVEWHTALAVIAQGEAYRGHAGLRQFVRDYSEAYDRYEVDLEDQLALDDLVIAAGLLRSVGKASGVEQVVHVGWLFKFRHGKVVYLRAFRDPKQALEAVG